MMSMFEMQKIKTMWQIINREVMKSQYKQKKIKLHIGIEKNNKPTEPFFF
jgi:hypothetical protein